MSHTDHFTVQQGFNVQIQQLNEWKSILKPEKYDQLLRWIDGCNMSPMKSGYEVVRGTDIDNWIMNNLMEKA